MCACDNACSLLQSVAAADTALKADFMMEIATMKKITLGNCPYVVNMMGCCTLQEPLSLVLEYIPSRDLRTYLWTIRQQVSSFNAHALFSRYSIECFAYITGQTLQSNGTKLI